MDALSMVFAELEAVVGPGRLSPAERERVELAVRRALGGAEHYIATAAALDRARLHARIRHAIVIDGLTPPEAAQRFGVSRQTAWRVSRAVG